MTIIIITTTSATIIITTITTTTTIFIIITTTTTTIIITTTTTIIIVITTTIIQRCKKRQIWQMYLCYFFSPRQCFFGLCWDRSLLAGNLSYQKCALAVFYQDFATIILVKHSTYCRVLLTLYHDMNSTQPAEYS